MSSSCCGNKSLRACAAATEFGVDEVQQMTDYLDMACRSSLRECYGEFSVSSGIGTER